MATRRNRLAQSLEVLRALQQRGVVAVHARDLSRTHRERLCRLGFLQRVMKGWYIPARPDESAGHSAAWYASYWRFCGAYLAHRFKRNWCLSPEQSLSLLAGNNAVPEQLLVRSPRARNQVTGFPHGTSLLEARLAMPRSNDVEEQDGLRLFSLPAALIACSPTYFYSQVTDARVALTMIRDPSEVLGRLLDGGRTRVAGRLAGAFRNVGRDDFADRILDAMRAAGHDVRESDPFGTKPADATRARQTHPYVTRLHLLWEQMRHAVVGCFPPPPHRAPTTARYLKRVDAVFVDDAYHSLSIEGYRVSPALVERVRSGGWSPDSNRDDLEHANALAARGYWQAHQAVREGVRRVLGGANPGAVADQDHARWYRELFAPSATAGLIRPADLAGYRTGPVFIRGSRHLPPSPDAVRDAMPALFDLLREEPEPSVRATLGHFLFVFIHPYPDGNGRMARFLMNVMLASGGYPWTVIPLQSRTTYMAALEAASVHHDIAPFADFLARRLESPG